MAKKGSGKATRRTYTRAWLKKNFKKAEVVAAFKHYEGEGLITRPLHGRAISDLNLEEFVDEYVQPNYVADFADYILKRRSDIKKKYDNLSVDQKAEAQVIKGYSKADISKALSDLGITITNKQSLQLHALASEIALTEKSNKVIKYLKENFKPKGKKAEKAEDSDSSSSSEEEKKQKKKNKKAKRTKKQVEESSSSDSSSDESSSESESSSEEEEKKPKKRKKSTNNSKNKKKQSKAKSKKNQKKEESESSSESDSSSDESTSESSDSEPEVKKKKRSKSKYRKH